MVRSAVALALLAGVAHAAATGPQVTLLNGVVRARPAAASATLQVFVDGAAELPALLGTTSREGDSLLFSPRFGLEPGMRYRAVYRAPHSAPLLEVFTVPAAAARPATRVERIDPSPDVLPENLLKLYVNFSAPMSRGEAYRRIRLLDESGRRLELAFLEIDEELWDREVRRLTLLFDPGRVKRDLLPNEEAGTPLREGAAYTLVVEREWPDAYGNPLERETRKAFRVGPPDYDPPQTSTWRLTPPRAGTRDPLTVTFPEPLDRALLERVLEVVRTLDRRPLPAATRGFKGSPIVSGGHLSPDVTIAGTISIDSNETRWRFTPRDPWKAGGHALRAETILEDLAGNSLGRRFEVDVFERVEDRALRVQETLKFRVE